MGYQENSINWDFLLCISSSAHCCLCCCAARAELCTGCSVRRDLAWLLLISRFLKCQEVSASLGEMGNVVPCLWWRIEVLSWWDIGQQVTMVTMQELKHSLELRSQSQCTNCGVDSAANRKDRVRIKPVAFRSWVQLLSHCFVSWQLCVNFWSGVAPYLGHVCISDNAFHIKN